MTLSGAGTPLVKANKAEVPSVTFSPTCLMKSRSIPPFSNEAGGRFHRDSRLLAGEALDETLQPLSKALPIGWLYLAAM